MKDTFIAEIKNDLKESQINREIIVAFIPIAFLSYVFHEFGHWTMGELLGTDMTLSINNSSPRNGYFTDGSDALWSAIGGPVFTILQGLICMLLIGLTKSVYAFSFIFFAAFSRFFAIVFGGIDRQDEAKIAALLDWNKYLVAAIVLTILFTILWRSHRMMKLNMKATGYYTVLSVGSILIVLGVNEFLF